MIRPIASHPRGQGILSAMAYLIRKQEKFDAVACVKEGAATPASFPSLFGMDLAPQNKIIKNALGNPLPSIYL